MDAGSVVDGRYEIRRPLSIKGGMGDVYLCLDRRLNREVAVKLIKPEHANAPEYRERFQREVDAAIALEGYDVVRIYDHGECAERHVPYCVMEYLRGRDLAQELAVHGPLDVARALSILLDVCKVIGAAHERKIIHRDLKPSNLFLEGPPSPRCSVRVLDFGIAKVLDDPHDGAITQLGGQPGSPNYMAPEQHRNEPRVDVAVDIWALGAILFEAVTGERAWPGEAHAARKCVLHEPTPSVLGRRPELPKELDRIIGRCLQKEPANRYATIRELEHDLRELQGTAGSTDLTLPTVARSREPGDRPSRQWPWIVAIGGLIIVLGASLLKSRQQPSVAPALGAVVAAQMTHQALAAAEPEQMTRQALISPMNDVTAPPQTHSSQSEQSTSPLAASKLAMGAQAPARAVAVTEGGRTKSSHPRGSSSLAIQAPIPNAKASQRLPSLAPQVSRTETKLKTQ